MKNTLTTIGAVFTVFLLTFPTLSDKQTCASGQDCPVAKYSGFKGDLVPNGKHIPFKAKCVATIDKNIFANDNDEIILDYKMQPDKVINTNCIASLKKRFFLTSTGTEIIDQSNKAKKSESKAITVYRGFSRTISDTNFIQRAIHQPGESRNNKTIITRKSRWGKELRPHEIVSFSIQLRWNNIESKKLKIIEREHQWESFNDKGSFNEHIVYSPDVYDGLPTETTIKSNRSEWLLSCKKCGAVEPPEPIKE